MENVKNAYVADPVKVSARVEGQVDTPVDEEPVEQIGNGPDPEYVSREEFTTLSHDYMELAEKFDALIARIEHFNIRSPHLL